MGLSWSEQDTKRRQRLMAAARRWHRQHALAECLLKDGFCGGPIARAHTVQNAAGLDCLVRDGHAYMIEQDPNVPASRFKLIGRNEATTFTGFCSHHDTVVFNEIDRPWDPEQKERLVALHAMRAAAREYWAKLNAIKSFSKVLTYYRQGNLGGVADHLGIDPGDVPKHPSMIHFWSELLDAYASGASRMESRFRSLRSQIRRDEFHLTAYQIHLLEGRPRVGAAMWSTPEFDFKSRRVTSLTPTGYLPDLGVCVIPEPGRSVVILAHHRRDRKVLGPLLTQLEAMPDNDRRCALSWYLVIHGENVAYAPDYVDGLDAGVRGRIEDVFYATIHDAIPYTGLPRIDFFS